MSQMVCVPFSCYGNLLVTDETSPLEPGNAHQRKYHAPGVGIVEVTAVNDPEKEILVLIEISHLNSTELAEVRDEVLSVDEKPGRVWSHPTRRRTFASGGWAYLLLANNV